jgi:putative ABC transport system permease protein
VLGVLFGIGASLVVGRTLQWPMQLSPGGVVLAALFSTGVGVVFGYYPARKASLLDPIEAVRYE